MTETTRTAGATELAVALVRLSHVMQQVFADVGRAHDLTPQQIQLLCAVSSGPVGMTELSRWLHLGKSNLTGLVDRVERRGLVARTRDLEDGRACRIALTPQGSRLASESHAEVTARVESMFAGLSRADVGQVTAAVTEILSAAPASAAWPEAG